MTQTIIETNSTKVLSVEVVDIQTIYHNTHFPIIIAHIKVKYENNLGVFEADIPKMQLIDFLGLKNNGAEIQLDATHSNLSSFLMCNHNLYRLIEDGNKDYFTIIQIEEKRKPMTIEDIEKELGYKIELIQQQTQKEN